jgi:amidase
MEGQDSLASVLGPLSTDLCGIRLFMQAVIGLKPWLKDPLSPRKQWNEDEYRLTEHGGGKKLTFGILWNDGLVVPQPPVIRALEMTKEAVIAAGHDVVDWKPHKHAELYEVTTDIWAAAGEADYAAIASQTGEPILKSMSNFGTSSGTAEAGVYIKDTGISAFELFQIQKRRATLRKEYLDYWQSTESSTSTGRPVDAIISPVAPFPPPPHGKNSSAEYTCIWNALDYPACVFPVTEVDPVLDQPKPAHQFLSKADQRVYELYDSPETFKKAPVGLQLVGQCQEDEAVIAMTEIVDAALRGKKA